MASFVSRWGVRGSNEISDGLTAVYRFEHKLDSSNATLDADGDDELTDDGRLSFVGLSGGFGTLTLGQIWGAEYNSTGAILDNSYFYGSSQGSYRVGDAVSYAMSTGPVSLQLDAIMNDNPKSLDRMLVGASAGFGSGKVAVSYDSNNNNPANKTTNTTIAGEVSFGSLRAYLGFATNKSDSRADDAACRITKCRSTFGGVGGSVGDSGISFLVQATQKRDAAGKPTEAVLTLARSLGGGTTVVLESLFNTKDAMGNKADSTTALALKVDF